MTVPWQPSCWQLAQLPMPPMPQDMEEQGEVEELEPPAKQALRTSESGIGLQKLVGILPEFQPERETTYW